jgi:hypothetical protein
LLCSAYSHSYPLRRYRVKRYVHPLLPLPLTPQSLEYKSNDMMDRKSAISSSAAI